MNPSWTIDEIRGFNPLQIGQSQSQLDHLVGIAATSEDELAELADWHETEKDGRVLCIFQLPFEFSETDTPIVLPAQAHGVSIEASFMPQKICCDVRGNIYVAEEQCAPSNEVWSRTVTRCVLSLPVWGKRAQYYDAYQARCLPTGVKDELIIPAHESWIMDRALRTKDYEYNLVRRMLREVLYAIRILLRAIRVTTLYHCNHDNHYSGMFWMPTPGRITYSQPPRPIVGEILQNSDAGGRVVIPSLESAIRHRLREVTKFERALVSFETIRRQGDAKAALIGLTAVIESVLKDKLSVKANLARLLQHEALNDLCPTDISVANQLRTARNSIVHEYLTTEKNTGRSHVSKRDVMELNRDLDRLCTDGIQSARNIFRHLNLKY